MSKIRKTKEWREWFSNNLIYCRDTHSFVHRLFNEIKDKGIDNPRHARSAAFKVLDDMDEEFREELNNK